MCRILVNALLELDADKAAGLLMRHLIKFPKSPNQKRQLIDAQTTTEATNARWYQSACNYHDLDSDIGHHCYMMTADRTAVSHFGKPSR